MQPWLVRGVAMAVVYAATETVLAEVQVNHPTSGSVLDPILLALLVGASGLWAGIDGWLRRPRRGMTWFYSALIGGLLAGVLSVIARGVFVDQTGVWALAPALTGDAAFIALLIMLPAGLGIAVGGRLQPPPGIDSSDSSDDTGDSDAQGRRSLRSVPRG
jgi:hypothetical protein